MSEQITKCSETPPEAEAEAKPYHHGNLRQKLISVIQGLIEEDGPDGFSVAEAARRAGVSSAAPYKHFKDRTEILHAICFEAMTRLGAEMRGLKERHPPGSVDAVAALGLAYITFAKREPGVFRVMFSLTDGQDEDPTIIEQGSATFGIVKDTVAECFGPGAPQQQIDLTSYMLWTSVHGHAFLEIDSKSKDVAGAVDDWFYLQEMARRLVWSNPARGQ